MTDKKLIRQEIERIEQILDDFNKTHNNTIDNGIVSAKKNICKQIKSFIDSLPEEHNEDLEEEIENYINRNFSEGCDGGMLSDSEPNLGGVTYCDLAKLARHFAEWQKQQMMKDATDGEITLDIDGNIRLNCPDVLYVGDKVKIIIIKED